MPNTLGGHASSSSGSGASLASGAFSLQPTAGSTVLVWISNVQNTSEVISSVTDNASGNTYALVAGTAVADGNGNNIRAYLAKNVNTVASFSVTATFTGSTLNLKVSAVEIKGADVTAPTGQATAQAQTAVGTGANAVTSGAVTTTTAGEFASAFMVRGSGGAADTITPGTGFTSLHTIGGIDARSEYQIQTSAGSIAGTFTQDVSGNTVTGIVTIKAASGVTNTDRQTVIGTVTATGVAPTRVVGTVQTPVTP